MQLVLLDTGYVGDTDVDNQTQLNNSQRAGYDGSDMNVFYLDVQSISYSFDTNLNNKPTPNNTEGHRTTVVSTTNPVLNMTVIINKELVTTNHQYNNLQTLLDYSTTRGLKLLYPSNTTDNTKKTVVEALGQKNIGGNFTFDGTPLPSSGLAPADTPYLLGHVIGPSVNDGNNSNFFRVSFKFVVYG